MNGQDDFGGIAVADEFGGVAVEEPEVQGPPEAPPIPQDTSVLRPPTLQERIRGSGVMRELGREYGGGADVSPVDIGESMFRFASVPPPAANVIRKVSDIPISILPDPLAGLVTGAREVGLTFPVAAGAVGMGKNIGRALLGLFTGDFILNIPEIQSELNSAWKRGDTKQAFNIATQAILGGALLTAAGVHEVSSMGLPKGRGLTSETQRQAVEFTEELRQADPKTFTDLANKVSKQTVTEPQRQTVPTPVIPIPVPRREEVPPEPTVPPTAGAAAVTAAGEAPAAASEAMRQRVEAVRQAGKTAPASAAEAAKTIADEAVKTGRAKVEAAPAEPAAPAAERPTLSTGEQVIPAWKQSKDEILIAGRHEPFAKSETYFDEHGFFVSKDIPDFAWDLDMRTAGEHPRGEELYRPSSSGTFISMREYDAAGGDIEQALKTKRAAPAAELEMAVTKPDFIADNSEPFGSDRWRMKNGVGPDDKLIQIEDGGWVSESPPMNVKGQWAKFVRTVNARGEGKVIPVNVEAPKKGVIYAPEEGKVKTGVQPERVRTDAQRVSAEAGPRDSVQPEATVGTQAAAPPGQAPREVLLKPKEPWEMTQKEYVDKDISIRTSTRKPSDDFLERLREQARLDHQTAVQIAIQKGKPVPAEVLADYPDLKATPSAAGPRGEVREEVTESGFAVPTLPEGKHYLFHSEAGDVASKKGVNNVFIVRHFNRMRDARELAKSLNDNGVPAKVEAWLKGPKSKSMWTVLVENVSQTFADTVRAKMGLTTESTPPKGEPKGGVPPEVASASTASPGASTAGGVAPPPAAVGQPTVTPTVAKGQAPDSATMPEGPGAMTRGQRPYSAAQQLIDQLKAQPPAGVREKLSTSEKIADAWAQGKSAWNRAMARGQAITQTLKETARGVRSPTDVDRHVASLDWALQQSAGQSRIMGKQMERQWRNITDREAAAIWIDAGGDEALIQNVLANLPTGTRPNVRRAVARAANLPTNIKADLVNELRQFYSLREQDAVSHELFEQGLNDYFTHIWQKPENMPDELRAAITNGRVQTWWQFKQQREIPTFLNGIMQGKTPVLDPAKVLPFYNYSLDRAIASREFIKGLNDLTAPDGRPVVAPWGTSKQVPQGQTPQALIIKPTAKAQRKLSSAERQVLQQTGLSLDQAIEQGLITPVATADYRTIDHPAMRKWKWAGTSKAGAPILFESELAVHPDYYERLARFMDRGRLSPGPAVRSLLRASTEVKGMKLGLLSAFHQIHVGSHALWHLTNPFKSKWLGTAGEIDWESPSVQFAVEKGHLKLAPNPNELGVFAEGILGPGLIHKIPGIGPVSRAYSEWLFGDFIPRLKLATFENAYQRNMKWYEGSIRRGKITPEEVAARVGDSVNNAYGELNQLFLGKYGRSPGLQRILRGVFLAPDFGEARLRFVEKAFTKYGNEERMALALMFTTMYTAARVSNWYSHGDPEWDSKNAFRVKVGDHWWTMRSVVGDLAHAFSNLSQFMYVRLNPLYSRTVMDWLYSRDYQGRKLSAFDKVVKRPLEQLIPIQLGSLTRDDQKLWESFITAMGVSASHERPVAEVNEAVRKWMLSSGDPLLQAMGKKREQELFAPSAYAPLRRALLEQNWKKAKTEYIALRNLHDHKIIDRTLNPRTAAGEKPLGALGRKQWLAFLQSVKGGTSEAKSVAAALEERDLIYARFKQLMAGQQ